MSNKTNDIWNENLEEIKQGAFTSNKDVESWWWGYKHKNGKNILKRYLSQKDLEDADESDMVLESWGPFKAYKEDAQRFLDQALGTIQDGINAEFDKGI